MCVLGLVYQLNGQYQRAYDMYMQVIDEGPLVEEMESTIIIGNNIQYCIVLML